MCAAEQLPEVEAQTEEADEGAFQQTFRWSVEVTAPERIAALVGGQMEDYRVPIRYLPPGKLVDLWYQFLSWVETQRKQGAAAEGEAAIPSWATFYTCWTELFHKRCLRFREKSQHAECDDCFRFRQQLGRGGISAADSADCQQVACSLNTAVDGQKHLLESEVCFSLSRLWGPGGDCR